MQMVVSLFFFEFHKIVGELVVLVLSGLVITTYIMIIVVIFW